MHNAHQNMLGVGHQTVLASGDIKEQLLRQAWALDDASPAKLAQRISADRKMYNALIAKKKLQLE